MADLNTDVRYIKGIGEQRAKTLGKLGIATLRDLVGNFPRAYEDRTAVHPLGSVQPEETACVCAMVAATPRSTYVRKGMELLKFRAVDDTGAVDVTFFNQSYVRDRLRSGEFYWFHGKFGGKPGRLTLANPAFEQEDQPPRDTRCILPVYHLTAGISGKVLSNAIRQGLDACGDVLPDALPARVREKMQLAQTRFAYENIHFPADFGALELARRRLIFEEFFVLACALGRLRSRREILPGKRLEAHDTEEFYVSLPFAPTGAQRRAAAEALGDMASGRLMNRLIQGDVGSGKTLVAALCAWNTWKNGRQTAFMAPTEILAEQHLVTFRNFLEPFGVRVARLTGAMTAKEKRETKAALERGDIDLVIGTHALLSEGVNFRDLALVITDEQHRFGVQQRESLSAKGDAPHILVMSATPIPRTLALIIYGDLDVSVIDELPPGRQKVDTFAVGEDMRGRIYAFMRRLISEGRQVFVVCPMIEENEEQPQNLKSALEYAREIQEKVFPDLRVGCVHGKMKAKEKDAAMTAFVNGETHILVSTTVIEVGVDVPNAALMVVENAERFGLSQLHQLRGRVGRGQHKSYCILFSNGKNEVSRSRLQVMTKTNDGFKVAEEDLRLRGPGDFFGARQHGLPDMHIAHLCMDVTLMQDAQREAQAVLAEDPELEKAENAGLRDHIAALFRDRGGMFN